MNRSLQDLRYALRMLGKSRAFTLVTVLTLALGIGANTAMFSVADALLLRPLPYREPERLLLVEAWKTGASGPFSLPRFEFLRDHSRSFAAIAAFTNETFNLSRRGDPEQLASARVSWNFFELLGVRPALGRAFTSDEDEPGGRQVVLISSRLWAQRFGRQPDVVGQSITLDSRDYTVIGVLPEGFEFPPLGAGIDIWAPRVYDLNLITPARARSGTGFLNAVARLRPDIAPSQAQAEMDVLNQQYRREFPKMPDAGPGLTIVAGSLQEHVVANVRRALLVLVGAVAFLLLIACANVASLLVSRALGRRREIAVRAALGASRGAVMRQLLTESVALAAMGGALGVLLSAWGTRALSALLQGNLPRAREIAIDGPVLAFAAALSLLTGLLFGLMPALHLSKPDLNSILRGESRGSIGGAGRGAMRNLLVVAQVALSMVLLIGAGLLIRSFARLESVNPGFDPHNLLTMNIALAPAKYATGPQMVTFFDQAVAQVAALPGVRSAAAGSALPVNAVRFSPVLVEGQPPLPLAERPILEIEQVSPGYLQTMRIPLVRGREFTPGDDAKSRRVAMVNETLARRFWPGPEGAPNPIGKRLTLGRMTESTEVVGVVGDVKNIDLASDVQPGIYLPFAQLPWASMNLVVRTAVEPHGLVSAVRHALAAVDREQPVTNVKSMDEVLAASTAQRRMTMLLLGVFSASALLLAMVGIYGVVSYSVAERTQELGVRIALGAEKADILRLVIGRGLALACAGVAIGLAGSLALSRVMSSLLYQVSAADPIAFGASAALFLMVALAASYLPARRATRLDPMDALRHE